MSTQRYTLAYLKSLPTLSTAQADDLKIEDGGVRVWLARTGIEDGEPYNNKVTIEVYNQQTGRWEITQTYQAR